jgi:pimeloyl-ACP methyl ester carboxylesterase
MRTWHDPLPPVIMRTWHLPPPVIMRKWLPAGRPVPPMSARGPRVAAMADPLRDDDVRLPDGPRLALRRADGPGRPFLLVHGLSSNARLWDGVGRVLAAAGHQVVAVDQRGHGRSEQVPDGYTTAQCAADLAALCDRLGLTGARQPVVAGQSWGGNVVLTLAADHGGVAAVALVDGGWIRLGQRYPTFDQCWAELAPRVPPGITLAQLGDRFREWFAGFPPEAVAAQLANLTAGPDGHAVARLTRAHHREILRSMWEVDPRPLFPRVSVPVLIAAAVPTEDSDRPGPDLAASLLPDSTTSLYVGAHHDLHAQHPDRLAAELLHLSARAEAVRL